MILRGIISTLHPSLHLTTTTPQNLTVNKVFVAVGFPKRDPAKIWVALLGLEYNRPGDGVFNAIIWDVVVEELVEKGIGNIALYSEPRVLSAFGLCGRPGWDQRDGLFQKAQEAQVMICKERLHLFVSKHKRVHRTLRFFVL